MKTFSILLLSTLILNACGSMKPDDKLQKVLSGDLLSGPPPNPAEVKRLEQKARENERIMPRREEQKGLGLKMDF